ncbi:MAG: Mov34/MPN/PAD-1 family protein [Chloroflexota bacterium]
MIPKRLVRDMIDHARGEFPNEACGLLAARAGIATEYYGIANVEASPVRYRMEPKEQLDAMLDMDERGFDLGAIYHSHTHTPAYPSTTDIRLASYPEPLYIIVSLARPSDPELRGFRIVDGQVEEVPLAIQD